MRSFEAGEGGGCGGGCLVQLQCGRTCPCVSTPDTETIRDKQTLIKASQQTRDNLGADLSPREQQLLNGVTRVESLQCDYRVEATANSHKINHLTLGSLACNLSYATCK
jgi:hypothetical protein